MPGELRHGGTVTPNHVRECGRGLWDANQSPLVSGTSRSERPCDKHTLFERIGVPKAHSYGAVG